MKNGLYIKNLLFILLAIGILIGMVGCSNEDIKLCDYKSIPVPSEIKIVSKEDLELSIQMRLREKEVLIEKENNFDLVEDNDVIDVKLIDNDNESAITIVVGNDDFYHGFDEFIVGKKKNIEYTFEKDNFKISFVVLRIMRFAETATDDIAQKYFGFDSKALFEEFVEDEIAEHRVFEHKYEYLLNNSQVNIDSDAKKQYVEQKISDAQKAADSAGVTIETYIKDEAGLSVSEYKESVEEFYCEFMILEQLMKQEGVDISENAMTDYADKCAEELSIDIAELWEYNSEEDVRYQMYYDKCFDILMEDD